MTKQPLASLVLLIGSSAAQAQPSTQPAVMETAQVAPADPSVAITVSPFLLLVPMAEVTAEFRLAPKVGVSVIGGFGMLRTNTSNEQIRLFEAGASARYYLTGSFRGGLQLGAEGVYVHASTTRMDTAIKAAGLGLSPFVGYKWTHRAGFTLEGQLGATFMTARAKSSTTTVSDSAIGPMLNLQAGWSF